VDKSIITGAIVLLQTACHSCKTKVFTCNVDFNKVTMSVSSF